MNTPSPITQLSSPFLRLLPSDVSKTPSHLLLPALQPLLTLSVIPFFSTFLKPGTAFLHALLPLARTQHDDMDLISESSPTSRKIRNNQKMAIGTGYEVTDLQ